jgi:hypothetical protein
MDFVREVINTDKLENIIFIPANLKHRIVEIILVPIETGKTGIENLRGSLKKYANHDLIDKENEAWGKAAEEKYANR